MTQNNSGRPADICDHTLPTYEAATGRVQPRNEVVLNVADIVIHNERAPLITTDSGRSNTNRPPAVPEDTFDGIFRQNALPAFYQAANVPRNGQIDRCQTYKNITAVILATIAIVLSILILVYAHENFNPHGF